jgi:TRAP-type C4-dicarboxylate transport system substrate-binding protein
MIKHYDDLTPEEKAHFDKTMKEAEEKERKWFKDRGITEADMMYADAAYKEYMRIEEKMPDRRPFDKAPGPRRLFMMGYFYGKGRAV